MTHHRLSLPVSIVKQYTLDVIRRRMLPIQLGVADQPTTLFPKRSFMFSLSGSTRAVRWRSDTPGGHPIRLHLRAQHLCVGILHPWGTLLSSGFSLRPVGLCLRCRLRVPIRFRLRPAQSLSAVPVPYSRGYQRRSHPQEAHVTTFIQRCGPLFDLVFHTIVEIVRQAGFISGRALTTDGMPVPTWRRPLAGGLPRMQLLDTPICPL